MTRTVDMQPPLECAEQARQIVALLPVLRRWVSARVQQAGCARDLSLRQYAALQGIRDGATSPGDLARLWQVTPAVVTGIVDRLERRDLVRRQPDASDRRRQRLALTPAGLAASEEVERILIDDLAEQLAGVTPEELAELGRALALLHRSFATLEHRALPVVPASSDQELPVWAEDEPIPVDRLAAPDAGAVPRN